MNVIAGFFGGLLGVLFLGVLRGILRLVLSRTGRWVLAGVVLYALWATGQLQQFLGPILLLGLVYLGLRTMFRPLFGRGRR